MAGVDVLRRRGGGAAFARCPGRGVLRAAGRWPGRAAGLGCCGLRSRRAPSGRKGKSGVVNGASVGNATTREEAIASGPSTDLGVIWGRFTKLSLPYWTKEGNEQARQAQVKLAGVFVLTLGCTGVSVLFNFLGRDFYNALAEKNADNFWHQMQVYLVAIPVGIPVYIFRDFFMSKLTLEWRKWMTADLSSRYFASKRYYKLQGSGVVDNPDQRLSADVNIFTDTALGFSLTVLNCVVDLVSFSDILYTIYPPLFAVLVVYAVGGTAASVKIGAPLVGIKFQQEKREADFRYSLVRVRDNAESIAFYRGERREMGMLEARLQLALDNLLKGILKSRDLSFFQSFYKYIIQLLPAAVIAPLFFRGEIEFGVINQSASAFNHILTDVSLVVYQFESLAGFSATIDRLGQFVESLEEVGDAASDDRNAPLGTGSPGRIRRIFPPSSEQGTPVVRLDQVSLYTPDGSNKLIDGLSLESWPGDSLLVMGRSGVGKTSLLRAMAGLWEAGGGGVEIASTGGDGELGMNDVLFLPQRPYMVLGTLRDQLLYPFSSKDGDGEGSAFHEAFSDAALRQALREVRLGDLLDRCDVDTDECGLDLEFDWAATLSLGEQQRLAFARLLVTRPSLVIFDEATSALDIETEAHLYGLVQSRGMTYISVGHRPTLLQFHGKVLQLRREGEQASYSLLESAEVDYETYFLNS